jgi:hypothetical protein
LAKGKNNLKTKKAAYLNQMHLKKYAKFILETYLIFDVSFDNYLN